MISRILIAVDDSPAALAAARAGIDLALATHADVRAVHALTDHQLNDLLGESVGGSGHGRESSTFTTRRGTSGDSLLRHVEQLAKRSGLAIAVSLVMGEPARAILARARLWHADLIVLGRSDRVRPGEPYIGHEAQHVLEFAGCPVLVVPAPAAE